MVKCTIEGHTIEIRGSSTGSIDPWTIEKATEFGISLSGTSDLAEFIRIDGEHIYKLKKIGNYITFSKLVDAGFINSYPGFMLWLSENAEPDSHTSYKKSVEWLRQRRKI